MASLTALQLLCCCVFMVSAEAVSETCFESLCEFTLVVSEFRSMTFKNDADGKAYDVRLNENGTLNLVTSRWHLNVPNITISPDMVYTADGSEARNIILVNGRFPGPTLEVMEGSEVAVKVINNMEQQGITIHWHGIHLRDNLWMDGVPYITQCPIHPRQSFTYRFLADPAGTHFYHSHTDLQRLDGLFGALIVRRRNEPRFMPYFVAVLSDWFPVYSAELQTLNPYDVTPGPGTRHFNNINLAGVSGDGVEVSIMEFWSGLINGRGRKGNNSAPLTVFVAKEGERHRMHIVSSTGDFSHRFSIDGHLLTVIESDGHVVKPVENLESVIVYPGERYVVEFEANKAASTYWVRASSLRAAQGGGTDNTKPDGQVWEAKAILKYGNKTDSQRDPISKRMNCTTHNPCKVLNCPWPQYRTDYFPNVKCIDIATLRMDKTRELDVINVEEKQADEEIFLNMAFFVGSSINRRRMIMPTAPLFQNPSTWGLTPCKNDYDVFCSHMINLPLNKTVQLVLMSNIFTRLYEGTSHSNGGFKVHHAMHIHGYSFRVLKVGYPVVDNVTGRIIDANPDVGCDWQNDKKCLRPYWTNQPDLNLENPPLKDTVVVPAMGYTVVRFETNNPGYWLFHCHTVLHNFEGMSLVFNVSYDHHPPAPSGFPTCGNFEFSHDDFKMRANESEQKEKKDEPTNTDLKFVETLSAIAASCSSISLVLQILLMVSFLRFICGRKPKKNAIVSTHL